MIVKYHKRGNMKGWDGFMGMHKLLIAQDRGSIVSRTAQYIKPELLNHIKVVVKNLMTQTEVEYDKYHCEFEDGHYVLFFIGEDGHKLGHKEITLKPQSAGEIFYVCKWSAFISFLNVREVTEEEFDNLSNQLITLRGFQGY